MRNVERAIGAAAAGILAIIAVLILINPLLQGFSGILQNFPGPGMWIVGGLLLLIAGAIFQAMTRSNR